MDLSLQAVWHYLVNVFLATLNQLFILLGLLLILAIIMHFVATACQNLGYRLFGSRLFLNIFGWLGTAVHEMGHALFALLFFHKITEMKLFSPDSKKGTLGYVNHTWNSKNLYQTVGNFFIGIGPILMGSIMLYLVTWMLFFTSTSSIASPTITAGTLSSFSSIGATVNSIFHGVTKYFAYVFNGPESTWWKVVLFLYLIYSIGSSVTLSMEDIKGAFKGFLIFVLLLFLFNLCTIWIGGFTTDFFRYISSFFSAFYFLIILSILINIIFMVILLLLLAIRKWIFRAISKE